MFANVKRERERERVRERERERLVQAPQSKHSIGGSTSRGREREMCVCYFLISSVCFFLLWELVYVFQRFVSIFAKNFDRTRCLAVSILEYNLGPKITGFKVQY